MTSDSPPSNALTFFKLHLAIFLAGFTGVLGKLISLDASTLVWYRMLLTTLIFGLLLAWKKQLVRITWGDFMRLSGLGLLIAFHWIFFYASIKASNVSIGVICFSLVGFFTALLEPFFLKHRYSLRSILFSMLSFLGISLIFSFDGQYRLGIAYGVISALLIALFMIGNKGVCKRFAAGTLIFYQMLGGAIFLSVSMPFFIALHPDMSLAMSLSDWVGMLALVILCTIVIHILQIQVLRSISAFTVNLSYNLEPVYSIIIAVLFMGEGSQLNFSFYVGLGCIALSVVLESLRISKYNKQLQRIQKLSAEEK